MGLPGARVLLVDGNALAYRAFYAMPEMKTSKGEPVNAVLGFTNMLLRLLDEVKPGLAAVAFDKSLPSVRLEQYAEYKAQRQKMPESLGFQMGLIEGMVEALRIPVTWCEGHEADDCIASLTKRAVGEGGEVVIVSGDMDLLQLVSPGVKVLSTRKGISDLIVYDEKTVEERLQLTPAQIPDYKAIAGDPSDNIPGIAGIGETGAKKLLKEYGTLENILAHAEELPGKLREKVKAQGDLALRFKELTKLEAGLSLDVDWEHLRMAQPDFEKLKALLERLEFRALAKRLLPPEDAAPPRPAREYRVAASPAELDEAIAAARSEKAAALHVLVPNQDLAVLALAAGGADWAVPIAMPREGFLFDDEGSGRLTREQVLGPLCALLGDDGVMKYIYDVKSFLKVLGCPGDSPRADVTDVALGAYLLDPGERISVSDAAARHLGRQLTPLAKEASQHTTEVLAPLAVEHARAVLLMGPPVVQALEEAGMASLYRDVEMPLAYILRAMEDRGLGLDRRYLGELSMSMARMQDALQNDIWSLTGEQFNINSPKQLGEILFDRLGLPGAQKTKTGYATGSDVLEALLPLHPAVGKILQYREVAKLKSTYGDALPRVLSPVTGRLHTTLNQMIAATGRLSSTEPNLQNIPVRSELGRMIRRAFVSDPGCELLSIDYSQIELRILAHLSADEAMIDAFRQERDIHAVTAAKIFHVRLEDVTRDMRRKAKAVNFGLLYGMSAHGLAQRLGIARGEAKEHMDSYFSTFPKVVAFLEASVEQARRDGYVTSLLGRRRNFADLNSRNFTVRKAAERMALNAPIQGSAADLIKLAMVKVHELLKGRRGEVRMLLQVHDDLLFEVPNPLVLEVEDQVRRVMEGVYPLKVPLRVSSSRGANWADMTEM